MFERILLASLALLPLASSAHAQTPLTTTRVASGLRDAVWAGAPAGDPRIFVVQQTGQVRIVKSGVLQTPNFLSIPGLITTLGGETGLLGMAFHPDYANNGYFFLNYTRSGDGATVVSRWQVSATDPEAADPASETEILVLGQPFSNHNAGGLAFGPNDGYLYILTGDGGSGNDPGCRALNLNSLHGKVLRIDVDSGLPYTIPPDNPFVGMANHRGEVYHYGLRNPFRFGFDTATGDMFFGDVGQNAREEISFAAASEVGLNFGWRVFEGTRCNGLGNCPSGTSDCPTMLLESNYRPPIYELFGADGARSIIGGHVYRGCQIPDLVGTYFFADYYDEDIRSIEYDTTTGMVNNFINRTAELDPPGGQTIRRISSFGEDGFGEILIVDHTSNQNGEVFKIVPATGSASAAVERNGSGSNALCFANSTNPVIGNVWTTEVDASANPAATLTGIQVRPAPTSGSFVYGSEILIGGPKLYKDFKVTSGLVDAFAVGVPCDLSLDGAVAYSQGLILEGTRVVLCNALDLTVGFH